MDTLDKRQEQSGQFDKGVHELFTALESAYPGVAESMRTLNMSYNEYLTILQNAQIPVSFSASGTVTHTRINEHQANLDQST